jgi:hypothetical protein
VLEMFVIDLIIGNRRELSKSSAGGISVACCGFHKGLCQCRKRLPAIAFETGTERLIGVGIQRSNTNTHLLGQL